MHPMGSRVARHARANLVGYVALFVALGGTAVASGIRLSANSVGTKQLKNGAVTGAKVAKNTLTGANIKASTLGTVPSAVNATNATSAKTATSATEATTATNAANAMNAEQLGGQAPSAFQSRVSGTCASGGAIASIAASGTVGCQAANVTQMMGGNTGNINIDTGTEYLPPLGLSAIDGTESDVWLSSSNLAGTAGNLVAESSEPAEGAITVTLDVNGTPKSVFCTIPFNGSICSDPTDTAAIPAGAYVDISVHAAATASGRITFGWTDSS